MYLNTNTKHNNLVKVTHEKRADHSVLSYCVKLSTELIPALARDHSRREPATGNGGLH